MGEEDKGHALNAAGIPPNADTALQSAGMALLLTTCALLNCAYSRERLIATLRTIEMEEPSCDFRLAYRAEMLLEGFGQTDVEAYDPWVSGIELVTCCIGIRARQGRGG